MASLVDKLNPNLNPDLIFQPRIPLHEMSDEFTDREFPNLKSLLNRRGARPIADIQADYVGKVPGTDDNRMLGAAMELAPWFGPGILGRATARTATAVMPRLSGNALASRYEKMYNLPTKPLRPFADDYPFGAMENAGQRLTTTIEGHPLIAEHVAGRTVQGGVDQAISPEEFNAIGKGIDGGRISPVAEGHPKLQGP
jgi:hypothetical protein